MARGPEKHRFDEGCYDRPMMSERTWDHLRESLYDDAKWSSRPAKQWKPEKKDAEGGNDES